MNQHPSDDSYLPFDLMPLTPEELREFEEDKLFVELRDEWPKSLVKAKLIQRGIISFLIWECQQRGPSSQMRQKAIDMLRMFNRELHIPRAERAGS